MPIRLALVEDDPRLRAEYQAIVATDPAMVLVGAFPSAEAALADLPGLAPDVVLMDINLPGMNGIACVRRLKAALPAVQVVMLTAFGDSEQVFESLKAGATGYVLKEATGREVLEAIHDVHTGGSPISSAIARKLVQHFSPRPEAPEVVALTQREREVLEALSRGLMYKEVADELGVSLNTIRAHVRRIYETLQVQSRAEAVAKLGGPGGSWPDTT